MKKCVFVALIATALFSLRMVSAGTWSVQAVSGNTSPVTPMMAATNVLAFLNPYVFTNDASEVDVTKAANLTDRIFSYKKENYVAIYNNSAIYWDLSSKFEEGCNGVDLSTVRICSSWDSGRAQIMVGNISVKTADSGDSWMTLDGSSLTGPSGAAAYAAEFSNKDGSLLAKNVTHLMIDFGPKQQNGWVSYIEIEASVVLHEAVKVQLNASAEDERLGSILLSQQAADNMYPIDTEVTLTAKPTVAESRFVRWYGDVDESQVYNDTITIKMNDTKDIKAIFAKDWVWENNVMSDGHFQVTTSIADGKNSAEQTL